MSTHLPPRQPTPPPPRRPARSGCATVLLALVGAVLLTPGICVLVIVTLTYTPGMRLPSLDEIMGTLPLLITLVALSVGGILLIRAAFRS